MNNTKYFCVLYIAPVAELDKWSKIPQEERQATEDALRTEWNAWLTAHAENVKSTIGLSQAKRVDSTGVRDTHNGVMLSSYVEASSLEEAAELFKNHPHLKIPGATIDIMESNQLGQK